jgi:hypothetical protein
MMQDFLNMQEENGHTRHRTKLESILQNGKVLISPDRMSYLVEMQLGQKQKSLPIQ